MAALPDWTESQIIAQLDGGEGDDFEWPGSTITYAFPLTGAAMYGSGEENAFVVVDAATQAMLRVALQLWDDLIAPNLVEIAAAGLDGFLDADLEIGFSAADDPDVIDYAHSYYPDAGSMWMNIAYSDPDDINNLVNAQVGSYGFSTYVHELGHALGLDHPGPYEESLQPAYFQDSNVYTVMSYFGPGMQDSDDVAQADWENANGAFEVQTPQLHDILAIQSIYGASTTTRTGNTTYGFNSNVEGVVGAVFDFTRNANPIVTLFDSAGTDTLDLSGWNTRSEISLVPGSFTNANGMTKNIAIAASATIENAVGGGGNDNIEGNASANLLRGGGGNDGIQGGNGNDTLDGGAGNDVLNGELGSDVALFDAAYAAFTLSRNPQTGALTLVSPGTGTDSVLNVERLAFSDGTQLFNGTASADSLVGTAGVDVFSPFNGNDTLQGGGGNDLLDGDAGIDTAVYGSARAQYTVTAGTTLTVDQGDGSDGRDTLVEVERLRFADMNLAFDLSGNAGDVARVLGAVFGPTAVQQESWVGIGLELSDGGLDYRELMDYALRYALGSSPTHAQVVTLLYTNLFGSAPSTEVLNVFVGWLAAGHGSQLDLAALAGTTVENEAGIGLAGLAQTGLEFA